jgi:hypothetical protein
MSDAAAPPPEITELTDLAGQTAQVRSHLTVTLTRLLNARTLDFDFFRHWNGGWRVRVEIGSERVRLLEFALLALPGGRGILPLPRPFPASWRGRTGFPATDGSLWTEDEDGQIQPFEATATE